jgi:hypothetical protein
MGTRMTGIPIRAIILGSLLLLALCVPSPALQAQALEVPIALQVPLAVKSLSYARSLPSKLKDGRLVVGICYQEGNPRSMSQMQELSSAFAKEQFSAPIRLLMIPLDESGQPLQPIPWRNVSCLYLTVLRGVNLPSLVEPARTHGVMTFSTDPSAAFLHVTMGFELVGGRAKFAINLTNAEKEKCEFSSQLLKLAKIY